jgi:glycosyltransferase involved in cell wall biosynthesis
VENKGKVMIITDSPNITTGYGQVFRNIAKNLVDDDWSVSYVGLQHFGLPIWYYGTTEGLPEKPYKLYPRIGDSAYGFDITERYLRKINPDYLITLCDIGLNNGYIEPIRKSNWRGKWISYVAYDSQSWNPIFSTAATTPDQVVTMSKFAKTVIDEHAGIDSVYIPHGTDTKTYTPLGKKELKEKHKLPGFVVGAAGRNQIRKMWSRTIEGFAKFAKDKSKDDVMLLLHVEARPEVDRPKDGSEFDTDKGWSIPDLVIKRDISEKFSFTIPELGVIGRYEVSPKAMNMFYNMMDVYGFLTGGEGFGLPSLEAQAAGSCLVTTDYSTGRELTGDDATGEGDNWGYTVKVKEMWETATGLNWALADTDHYAKILENLYQHRDILEAKQKKAREFALTLDWEKKVCPMWSDLLDKM